MLMNFIIRVTLCSVSYVPSIILYGKHFCYTSCEVSFEVFVEGSTVNKKMLFSIMVGYFGGSTMGSAWVSWSICSWTLHWVLFLSSTASPWMFSFQWHPCLVLPTVSWLGCRAGGKQHQVLCVWWFVLNTENHLWNSSSVQLCLVYIQRWVVIC